MKSNYRRLLGLSVLALFASFPAESALAQSSAQNADSTRGFVLSSKDGQFTVTLPAGFEQPERKSETSESETGTVKTTTYSTGNQRGACLVSFSVYPKKLFKLSTPEQILDNVRDGAFGATDEGHLDKQEDYTVEGFQGRTVYFTATNQEEPLYSRFDWIIAEPYLYQVAFVAYNREDLDSPDVLAFFNSFKMTGGKGGK